MIIGPLTDIYNGFPFMLSTVVSTGAMDMIILEETLKDMGIRKIEFASSMFNILLPLPLIYLSIRLTLTPLSLFNPHLECTRV